MKIVFFGDSVTDACRQREGIASDRLGGGYVCMAGGALTFRDPKKYQVVNRGIGGDRIVDLYARIKKDVWRENPDVLSVLVGVNDVWHELGDRGNGVDLKRWERVYRMLIEDTLERFPKLEMILCEPFFLEGCATKDNLERFAAVKDYGRVAQKLAEEYKLHFLPLQDKLTAYAEKYGADLCLCDGVHPNAAGAQLIAKAWLELFDREIDR